MTFPPSFSLLDHWLARLGALNEEAHNATAVESKKGATAAHEGEASSSTEKSKQKRRSVSCLVSPRFTSVIEIVILV